MLPALFVSHGSPQLLLEGGEWANKLKKVGQKLRALSPELVLVVSAHWLTEETQIECSSDMKTLHDFSGFGRELYEFEYPARGNPELCMEIAKSIEAEPIKGRGLDHGAWAILAHLFPRADVPVSQVSIDYSLPMEGFFRLGEALRSFRDRVVLLASGGLVHNLMDAFMSPKEPPEWAVNFKEKAKSLIVSKDWKALIEYVEKEGKLAHPTKEHFVPLLYFLGSLAEWEEVELLHDGFEFGSIALTSFISVGGQA